MSLDWDGLKTKRGITSMSKAFKAVKKTFRKATKPVRSVGKPLIRKASKLGFGAKAIADAISPDVPEEAAVEAGLPEVEEQVRGEKDKLRRRRGFASAILTSPRGVLSGEQGLTRKRSLLAG